MFFTPGIWIWISLAIVPEGIQQPPKSSEFLTISPKLAFLHMDPYPLFACTVKREWPVDCHTLHRSRPDLEHRADECAGVDGLGAGGRDKFSRIEHGSGVGVLFNLLTSFDGILSEHPVQAAPTGEQRCDCP